MESDLICFAVVITLIGVVGMILPVVAAVSIFSFGIPLWVLFVLFWGGAWCYNILCLLVFMWRFFVFN